MLITRNALLFRKFFKEEVAREPNGLDLEFIGSLHPDKKRRETGFAKLIYGNRDDLGKLLGTIALNVAADDQAIYELIQNADDSKSSFFSISYDEKYLLCINNGSYFSDHDMSALINVAGNYKDEENIGTFGIGFKILHRLVGIDDGRDAIINDYAGPILFSWNKFSQFEQFLNGDKVQVGYDAETDKQNAWLIKVLYTCFPVHLGEKIRLGDYETQDIKFGESELNKMRSFLQRTLQNVSLENTNNFQTGSVFFLNLGKGKSKFLDEGIGKIISGLSYSCRFLNSLKKIYINGQEIQEQFLESFENTFQLQSPEFLAINPKNKKRDIKFTFAYYLDYKKAESLRKESVPNLYTFFSMDEEKNGFSFLLHCNAFDMNNDRRKLQANSQINEKLLPLIANNIILYIDEQKKVNRDHFLSLYANLLLSKEPQGKSHINNYFFCYLKNYLIKNIPTQKGYSKYSQNVKIKTSLLNLSPSDFGCPEIEWFYWYQKSDELLINEANSSTNLKLDKWNIVKLIEYAIEQKKDNAVNAWIRLTDVNNYSSLLKEIERNITRTSLPVISIVKLFKFSDENYYSLNEIFNDPKFVLNYEKTVNISSELKAIGFISSYVNISEYPKIMEVIQNKFNDFFLYQQIALRLKGNQLEKAQKHKLLFALAEFNNVGIEKLKDLELFKNTQGDNRPLRYLLKNDEKILDWLAPYKIHADEYSEELDNFLLKSSDIYQKIIFSNWQTIISSVTNVSEFYQNVKYYYDLDEKNTPLKNQSFVYTDGGFSTATNVFYNTNFSLIENYKYFQNAVRILTDCETPCKDVLKYLKEVPFKLENDDLFDKLINVKVSLDLHELKTILEFCKKNSELFFENYVIEKQEDTFFIQGSLKLFQIHTSQKKIRQFVEENINNKFKILPAALSSYKDESGILQGENLHVRILNEVDINGLKEQLVDIIAYDEAKRLFLEQLSEIRLNPDNNYDKESFEVKILSMISHTLKKEEYAEFRNKIVIEKEGNDIRLSEVPPFANIVHIGGIELSIAKILPDSHLNSNYLNVLINQLLNLEISQTFVVNFFGISQEPDLREIIDFLSHESPTLENAEQLAFVLLYNKFIEKIELKSFKLLCKGNGEYDLTMNFYLNQFNFLVEDAAIDDKYKDIRKILKEFPFKITDENRILECPYFDNDRFVCPDLKPENLSIEEKTGLLDFIFSQWDKNSKKNIIRNIDWTCINDEQTEKILGFKPRYSIFPSEFALEEEELPEYVQEWLSDNNSKIDFLYDLGVFTNNDTLICIRDFFLNQRDFNKRKIANSNRFSEDTTMLFNTLRWLKVKGIELGRIKEFAVFEEIVKVINASREKGNELVIRYDYDFNLLEIESVEWETTYYDDWKEELEYKFRIYLYKGVLPRVVNLGEIDDYIFL